MCTRGTYVKQFISLQIFTAQAFEWFCKPACKVDSQGVGGMMAGYLAMEWDGEECTVGYISLAYATYPE